MGHCPLKVVDLRSLSSLSGAWEWFGCRSRAYNLMYCTVAEPHTGRGINIATMIAFAIFFAIAVASITILTLWSGLIPLLYLSLVLLLAGLKRLLRTVVIVGSTFMNAAVFRQMADYVLIEVPLLADMY